MIDLAVRPPATSCGPRPTPSAPPSSPTSRGSPPSSGPPARCAAGGPSRRRWHTCPPARASGGCAGSRARPAPASTSHCTTAAGSTSSSAPRRSRPWTCCAGRSRAPSRTRADAAWLGEVVVHGGDVRRPLGLPSTTTVANATAVACFLAPRDVTVPSRSAIAGLRVAAVDGPFVVGEEGDPTVTGTTLALVMTMAGRPAFLDDLDGPGLPTLRGRISAN